MNHRYDAEGARTYLDSIYKDANKGEDADVQHLVKGDTNNATIQTVKYPPSVRLMVIDAKGDTVDVEVKMQGVLCGYAFPPLKEKPNDTSIPHIRNLRQHAKITGMGSGDFERGLQQIAAVKERFQQHVGRGNEVMGLDFLPYEGDPAIDSHARYFSDRDLIPWDKNKPFPPSIDPNGVLTAIRPQGLIRGPDNIVDYCEKILQPDGTERYKPIDPCRFKSGDVVELSFVYQAVPIKKNRYLMFLSLRAVALISDALRKSSEERGFQIIHPDQIVVASPNRIKRKQRYVTSDDEEETAIERKRHNGQSEIGSKELFTGTGAEAAGSDIDASREDTEMEEGEVTANEMGKLNINAE